MDFKLTAAAVTLLGVTLLGSGANAAPVAPASGASLVAGHQLPVETVQYYHNKRRYCFYWDGWHGPGWYWCGYHHRRGYGWGGPTGWNKWSHGARPRGYSAPHRRPAPHGYSKPAPHGYGKQKHHN